MTEKERELCAVLVHGMFSNKKVFGKMVTQLQTILPTYAIDLIGHGERKHETSKPISFSDYANDVREAVIPGPCILIGHSLGALASLVAYHSCWSFTQKNIVAIVTISSSGPRGIPLPFNVTRKMVCTPSYMKALIKTWLKPGQAFRFNVLEKHAREFMLNSSAALECKEKYAAMESESALVLRELALQQIVIPGPVPNVHMFHLTEDRLATPQMQMKLAKIVGYKTIEFVRETDHMGLDKIELMNLVTSTVQRVIKEYKAPKLPLGNHTLM